VNTYLYGTGRCDLCGDIGEVEIPLDGFYALMNNVVIQEALPTVKKELREQIRSGIHPECWQETYGTPNTEH